jgi:hypothetical protein
MTTRKPKPKFKVGDRVRFDWPSYKVWGTIIEDRGPLGVGGRRRYVVSSPSDPFEPDICTVSEDRLELDTMPLAPPEKPEIFAAFWEGAVHAHMKDEVAAYLLTFGLTPEEAEDVFRTVGVSPVRKPRRRKVETV